LGSFEEVVEDLPLISKGIFCNIFSSGRDRLETDLPAGEKSSWESMERGRRR
jgi:hypothetical protein